jgi:hypothetical protein
VVFAAIYLALEQSLACIRHSINSHQMREGASATPQPTETVHWCCETHRRGAGFQLSSCFGHREETTGSFAPAQPPRTPDMR